MSEPHLVQKVRVSRGFFCAAVAEHAALNDDGSLSSEPLPHGHVDTWSQCNLALLCFGLGTEQYFTSLPALARGR